MLNGMLSWKKSRWSSLHTLWDGAASWCLERGPVGAAGENRTHARLNPWGPLRRPKSTIEFKIETADESAVVAVLEELSRARHCLEAQRGLQRLAKVGAVSDVEVVHWN